MTIRTRSQFYYIDNITDLNYLIPFDDGFGEVIAEVDIGNFAPSELPDRIAFAMNSVGNQEYAVTYDRANRTYNITAPGNFDLLFGTSGSIGFSIHPTLGFNSTDLTGSNTYTSQNASGTSYRPQLYLQKYTDALDFQEAVGAAVNESASGVVETISYGQRKFYEFEIDLITDRNIGKNSVLEYNTNAVSEARDFLLFATTKSNLEFMKDRDNPDTFEVVLLESTASNRSGTGFRLREQISRGLDGFYSTGVLKFRVQGA